MHSCVFEWNGCILKVCASKILSYGVVPAKLLTINSDRKYWVTYVPKKKVPCFERKLNCFTVRMLFPPNCWNFAVLHSRFSSIKFTTKNAAQWFSALTTGTKKVSTDVLNIVNGQHCTELSFAYINHSLGTQTQQLKSP